MFLAERVGRSERHGPARRDEQPIAGARGLNHARRLDTGGREPGAAELLAAIIGGHADGDGLDAVMVQPVRHLARHFLFRVAAREVPGRGFDRVRDEFAECEIPFAIVRRERTQLRTQTIIGDLQTRKGPIRRDLLPHDEFAEQRRSSAGPVPFLQLEPKSVQFFIEEPLAVGVATEEPALAAVGVDARSFRVREQSASVEPATEPRDVRRHEQDDALAIEIGQDAAQRRLLRFDRGAAIVNRIGMSERNGLVHKQVAGRIVGVRGHGVCGVEVS